MSFIFSILYCISLNFYFYLGDNYDGFTLKTNYYKNGEAESF